jgi:hypothetical protein
LVFVLVRKVNLIERLAGLVKIYLDAKTSGVLVLKAAIGLVELDGLLEVLRVFCL